MNNTAFTGGIASIHDGSVVRFYDCLFSNNFAVSNGIIQSYTEGYVELYRCTISQNSAYTVPVMQLFIVGQQSVINNCMFNNNNAYSKENIISQLSI